MLWYLLSPEGRRALEKLGAEILVVAQLHPANPTGNRKLITALLDAAEPSSEVLSPPSMRTATFSIISPNYRHFARVLMATLARHHPDWDRFVLVIGDSPDAARDDEPFTVVPSASLNLPDPHRFFFRYTILELNTAVKPWMFAYLFRRGYDRVVYFDPDISVYSPLDELDALPPENFLTLTPHLTGSITGDDHPSERTILLAGMFNLGFLAVRRQPQLDQFLQWWQDKLEFRCVVDIARGVFVDQKWMDLTPGLFAGVTILRHDGYNVAYWNLGQRTVVIGAGGEPTANGVPLRFFHFSGYDPGHPENVSRNDPRQLVATAGFAGKLIDDYGDALRAAGYDKFRTARYPYGSFDDGTRVSDVVRVNYRESAELQAAAGSNPFKHPELFGDVRKPSRPPLMARAAYRSYRLLSSLRPLVGLVPKARRRAMREFLLGRPDAPPAPARMASTFSLPPGLNIVGYLRRDTGVGESARRCAAACEEGGPSSHLIDVDNADATSAKAMYRASIFHVNADQTLAVHAQIPEVFAASSYRIGCWHWELPELPDAWIGAAGPLDEIWAPSAFVQSAVGQKLSIPVVHMPHGVEVKELEPCSPQELGVPRGRFTFLYMFDFDSFMERKNPRAAAEAFRRAFQNESEAALLIKTVSAERHAAEYEALAAFLGEIPGVYLVDRLLPRARVNGLIAACDAVVSLHRSEGFGLVLAEAMDLGKPVVATGWSGNMDFMNSGNSCPTGYELVPLDRSYGDYQQGQLWAEPDVDHAAYFMKRLVDDAGYRGQIGERARQTIRAHFSPRAAGRRYRRRLEMLGLMGR